MQNKLMIEIRSVIASVGKGLRLTRKQTLGHEEISWGDGNVLYFDLSISLYVNTSIKHTFFSLRGTIKKVNGHAKPWEKLFSLPYI